MPGVDSANQVVFEDLSKAMEAFDQRQTPFFSRMKAGSKPEATMFSQAVEKMGRRRRGGVAESQDVQGYEGDQTRRIYGRTERFQRTPKVSVEAEELNRTAGLDSNKAYNGQVAKKVKENKRDINYWMLSDQESVADDGVLGSRLRGLGRYINDLTTGAATSAEGDTSMAQGDTPTAIPASLLTPTAQIYAGTTAAFLEADLKTIMYNRWLRCGMLGNFTFWVGGLLKTQISDNFGRYVPNKNGYAAIVQTQISDNDKHKLITSGIDVLETEYGTMTVELEPWMPTAARGYGVEMDQVAKKVLYLARHSEHENKGGGRRGLVDSILGAWFGDPRSHFKVCPSDETVLTVDFE